MNWLKFALCDLIFDVKFWVWSNIMKLCIGVLDELINILLAYLEWIYCKFDPDTDTQFPDSWELKEVPVIAARQHARKDY